MSIIRIGDADHLLHFDDEAHSYTIDGVLVPSVTGIASPPGGFYKRGSDERGRRVHRAAFLVSFAGAVPADLPADVRGYAVAWVRFLETEACKPVLGEVPGVAGDLRYAGTIDLVAEFRGRDARIDIKSGRRASWHDMQIVAYTKMHGEEYGPTEHGALVYLESDGTYRVWEPQMPDVSWVKFERLLKEKQNGKA